MDAGVRCQGLLEIVEITHYSACLCNVVMQHIGDHYTATKFTKNYCIAFW